MQLRRCLIAAALIAVCSHALPVWGAGEQFFDSDGVKIRYTIDGEGPPVVLIHGYRATGDLNWRLPTVISLLAKNYRVVTLDNRGHGSSDKPRDVAQYGEKMADDIIRLLDHLKIDRAHLVGYSMGGMITLKLLATHPERIRSAVIGGMGWVEQPEAGARGQLPEKATDLDPMQACAISFNNFGITRDQLTAIRVPATVVIGSDDPLLARRVEPLRAVRSDWPIIEIAGANHVNCIFRPEFRNAIKQFLDSQPVDSGTPSAPAEAGAK